MQNIIGLGDFRLLHAIGGAGTLAGAARELGVDHSTAFRRLGALEDRLGVKLFSRARDGYAPTSAGEEAMKVAERLLGDVTNLERRLSGEDFRPSGVVRVTTTESLLDLLAPILADFRVAYPGILVELVSSNAFLTLTRREADIAIRPAASAPENLAGRTLARVATALYAAPAYLDAQGDCGDLADYSWIGFDENLRHLRSALWMGNTIPSSKIACRANSVLGLAALARAGLGVAALPCYLGGRDPVLRRLGPPVPEMEVALWLLVHPDFRRVVRLRAFLDFLVFEVRKQLSLIECRS